MSNPESASNLGLAASREIDGQGAVADDGQFDRGGADSENEVNFGSESEHGGVGSEDQSKSGNESEGGETDSDDEAEHVESAGQAQIQPDTTNILSTFTPFSKLSIELRLKIWKYACFFTRNVDIWVKDFWISTTVEYGRDGYDTHHTAPFYFHSFTPPPPLLHVSNESRLEAIKYYQLDFATSFKVKVLDIAPEISVAMPPRIYINWDADRICVLFTRGFQDHWEEAYLTDRIELFLNRCSEMNLRCCAWNFDREVQSEFILWGADVEEMIIFSDDQWIDWEEGRLGRAVGDFEFEDMPKLERDVLNIMEEKEKEGQISQQFVEEFTSLSNVRYCKLRTVPKRT
jgi:hypothetical protein